MQSTTVIYQQHSFTIHSRLSFKPLIENWKNKVLENKEGQREFYGEMLSKVSQYPELLEPINDLSILTKHQPLIGIMMATIFPVSVSDRKDFYAVSIPFTYTTIYSSSLFKAVFLNDQGDMIIVPDAETEKKISEEKLIMSYQMVLNKYYGLTLNGNTTSVHPFIDPVTGLKKYLELELDANFIEVKPIGELPFWEEYMTCTHLTDLLKIPNLQESLPLHKFEFEGMVIIRIKDVTEREVISEIKNLLLKVHSFADIIGFENLQEQMQQLLGLPDVRIGIAPFFKINNHYVFYENLNQNSFLLKHVQTIEEKTRLCQQVTDYFNTEENYLVIPTLTPDALAQFPFLKSIALAGGKSLIICPLRTGDELIGALSFVADTPGRLTYSYLAKVEAALPLFALALEKSAADLDNQIDRVIKEQFTAVQSSVEWKFTEAALRYLTQKNKGDDTKVENIIFDDVIPLYGAVDVRNSSIERGQAIQQDLFEQLNLAAAIIKQAQVYVDFPILEEIRYRIDKHIYNVSNILFSGDEIAIHDFLKEEIVQLFLHLKIIVPGIRADIVNYFSLMDSNIKMLYKHRASFEESITMINNELSNFFDKEQLQAQKIFPHYFERFVTDGVDFNIYIGQSISPGKTFDNFYLRNIKLWQIATLAKAAQMSKKLEERLSLPLQTTQLILAHSNPISISFRPAERKFDVDGAYNIRYEIIKKRIDKVRIRDTNERLTQPGKIAIVFSQPKEASEYRGYIEFLRKEGFLTGEIERYDLEELQGVSGLKALRISVKMEQDAASEGSILREGESVNKT